MQVHADEPLDLLTARRLSAMLDLSDQAARLNVESTIRTRWGADGIREPEFPQPRGRDLLSKDPRGRTGTEILAERLFGMISRREAGTVLGDERIKLSDRVLSTSAALLLAVGLDRRNGHVDISV